MGFGSTTGRGFESELSVYVWGTVVFIALLFWIGTLFNIRKRERDERAEEKRDE
jgi:hypothetical protein